MDCGTGRMDCGTDSDRLTQTGIDCGADRDRLWGRQG